MSCYNIVLIDVCHQLSVSNTTRNSRDILVDVAGYVYPVDFLILDIKEDEKRPFILGTPFLATTKAVIKFDKGTITLDLEKNSRESPSQGFTAALAVLITGASQSRQHDTLMRLPTDIRLKIDFGKSVGSHKSPTTELV
ncbi:reverse transcriptase domain-containing protein [Tanacetum coccineum]